MVINEQSAIDYPIDPNHVPNKAEVSSVSHTLPRIPFHQQHSCEHEDRDWLTVDGRQHEVQLTMFKNINLLFFFKSKATVNHFTSDIELQIE